MEQYENFDNRAIKPQNNQNYFNYYIIEKGDSLYKIAREYYITKEGDTLDLVADKFKITSEELLKKNGVIYLSEGQILVNNRA